MKEEVTLLETLNKASFQESKVKRVKVRFLLPTKKSNQNQEANAIM